MLARAVVAWSTSSAVSSMEGRQLTKIRTEGDGFGTPSPLHRELKDPRASERILQLLPARLPELRAQLDEGGKHNLGEYVLSGIWPDYVKPFYDRSPETNPQMFRFHQKFRQEKYFTLKARCAAKYHATSGNRRKETKTKYFNAADSYSFPLTECTTLSGTRWR